MPAINSLSVIIPTHNRARSLKALLRSLTDAANPEGVAVDVFVVNNGSTDATRSVLEEEMGRQGRWVLTVLDEERPGKANALNHALSKAMGDLLLILDDDVVLHEACLVEHVEAYRRTRFAALQGKILPGKDLEGRSADLARLREYNIPHVDHGEEMIAIRGLIGTNMSFKREVFEKVGFFDTRLGPGASGFSEDTEYSIRIRGAGFKIGYVPYAIVYHELNPNRYGRVYNRDVQYRKGMSRSLYRHDSIVFRVVPDLLANCIRYGIYKSLGRTQKAYKTEGRIMKCWGYLMGKYRRRTGSSRSA